MGGSDPAVYPIEQALVALLSGVRHVTALEAVAGLVWGLLLAQSLHGADLVRALPDLQTAPARQAGRRGRRGQRRALLRSDHLTPHLMRAALRLVPEARVVLVLDSTRCGRWELFTVGLPVGTHARVLLLAGRVVAYPWPTGPVTPRWWRC